MNLHNQWIRMMAISLVQPADLLKTRMQLLGPAGKNVSAITVAKDIIKKEGFQGFYVGLSAALLRQATYTTGRLGFFSVMFDMYTDKYGVPSFPMKILLGVVAGGIGAFIGTPTEVALIRMTADGSLPPDKKWNYNNVFNAMSRIMTEEGLTALWRGAGSTVSMAMVVNGAQLGSYAQAREMLLPVLGDGLPLHTVSAMISGFVTTVVSLPVDIVKTRVMLQPDFFRDTLYQQNCILRRRLRGCMCACGHVSIGSRNRTQMSFKNSRYCFQYCYEKCQLMNIYI